MKMVRKGCLGWKMPHWLRDSKQGALYHLRGGRGEVWRWNQTPKLVNHCKETLTLVISGHCIIATTFSSII